MSPHADLFDRVAQSLHRLAGVERNRRGSLTRDGTVRAMTSAGRVVVRLPADRVRDLVADGAGEPYRGRLAEWLQLSETASPDLVTALICEALAAPDAQPGSE